MKWISGIIFAVIAAVFILFAIHNFHTVLVDLWPAPVALKLPVFIVVFVAILMGFVGGALVAWFGAGALRRKARDRKRTVRDLSSELKETQNTLPAAPAR